ncbi:MAG: CsbD family protein [Chloroflexi bacterium]|nr:CsbD family protein [Chloroflexota bacterium]
MDENKERAKGKLDEVVGNVKQGLGNLTGNERLEAEGRAQELGGESRQDAAKTVGTVKGMAEEAKGNLKQGVGELFDNEQMQAEGKAEELKGEGRQRFNQ